MLIGYARLPEHITGDTIARLQASVPAALLSHIHMQKEIVSLAQSLLGRYVLWQLLHLKGIDTAGIHLILSAHKQPMIADSPWQFNISHAGSIAVCALSDTIKPGIDIELVKKIDTGDFKNQFNEAEYDRIISDPSYRTFYQLWTAKEAVSKGKGEGLYIDFKQIKKIDDKNYLLNSSIWQTEEVKIDPSYICTVASEQALPAYFLQQFNMVQ